MSNDLEPWKDLKPGNLMKVAEKYVKKRRLCKAFDKVADRVEFVQELEQLKADIVEVQDFLKAEIKLIDSGKMPIERCEEDVVGKIRGYDVFSWSKLVRKWKSQMG